MAKAARKAERREDALSRERIVEAAITLLDEEGETGLTFRALATRLSTGPGAIYWHIDNKSELLLAASNAVVSRAIGEAATASPSPPPTSPRDAIHKIAVGVFEALDDHPWLGAQLSRAPWETATLQIFERLGQQIQALGVSSRAHFTAVSTLSSYILGVSIQNGALRRAFNPADHGFEGPVDRAAVLASQAARWSALDVQEYPFTRTVAPQLRDHDDLAEFLAGVDLILTGITAGS